MKSNKIIISLLIVLIVLVAVSIGLQINGTKFSVGSSSFEQTTQGAVYTNTKYKFSLTFPATWGEITEETVANPTPEIDETLELASVADSSRHMTIYIVPQENTEKPMIVDLPATKIGQTATHEIFIYSIVDIYGRPGADTSEAKVLSDEIEGIYKTFKAL